MATKKSKKRKILKMLSWRQLTERRISLRVTPFSIKEAMSFLTTRRIFNITKKL